MKRSRLPPEFFDDGEPPEIVADVACWQAIPFRWELVVGSPGAASGQKSGFRPGLRLHFVAKADLETKEAFELLGADQGRYLVGICGREFVVSAKATARVQAWKKRPNPAKEWVMANAASEAACPTCEWCLDEDARRFPRSIEEDGLMMKAEGGSTCPEKESKQP